MKKQQFIQIMEALKAQSEHDSKCADAFQVILPDGRPGLYNTYIVTSPLINLLADLMNNESELIEYFIHELNFGAKYYEGIYTIHGKAIDISDAGKLYDHLLSTSN